MPLYTEAAGGPEILALEGRTVLRVVFSLLLRAPFKEAVPEPAEYAHGGRAQNHAPYSEHAAAQDNSYQYPESADLQHVAQYFRRDYIVIYNLQREEEYCYPER